MRLKNLIKPHFGEISNSQQFIPYREEIAQSVAGKVFMSKIRLQNFKLKPVTVLQLEIYYTLLLYIKLHKIIN